MPDTEVKPRRKTLDEAAREVKASLPDDPIVAEPFEEDILGIAPDRPGEMALPLTAKPAAETLTPPVAEQPKPVAAAPVTEPPATIVAPVGAEPPAGSVEVHPDETPPPGYVVVEYQDADTGETYAVLAKESVASKVQNGYARKASWSRATGYLGKYRADFEPLITSGAADDVVRILRLARGNQAFGQHLFEAAARAEAGQPLTWSDVQAANAAAQPAAIAPAAEALVLPEGDEDVFGIGAATRSTNKRLDEIAQRQAAIDKRFTTADEQSAAQEQAQRQLLNLDAAVKAELRTHFPAEFNGTPNDELVLARAVNYAKESGMFAKYQMLDFQGRFRQEMLPQVPAIVRLAKMELENVGYDATPIRPSGVVGIAEADAMATRAAREAARQVAGTAGGGSASAPAPAPVRLVKPPTRDAKGRMIPIDKYTKSPEYQAYVRGINEQKKAAAGGR